MSLSSTTLNSLRTNQEFGSSPIRMDRRREAGSFKNKDKIVILYFYWIILSFLFKKISSKWIGYDPGPKIKGRKFKSDNLSKDWREKYVLFSLSWITFLSSKVLKVDKFVYPLIFFVLMKPFFFPPFYSPNCPHFFPMEIKGHKLMKFWEW